MIINTKQGTVKIRKSFKSQEPAILTKKDGSIWKITGKRKKKLTFIKYIKRDDGTI